MDHTSTPDAVHYHLSPDRLDLASEFRAHIRGPYSKDLSMLLARMRWGPAAGRYLLIVIEPGVRWQLARMPAGRGTPVERIAGVEFTSLDDAEWHVFKLRWAQLCGSALEME